MKFSRLHRFVCVALAEVVVVGGAYVARAEDAKTQNEGRIVRISSDDGQVAVAVASGGDTAASAIEDPAALSKYRAGILLDSISPEVRAQLDIPEDQGVFVRRVVANSPAAKAGLKDFDILLRANDTDLHKPSDVNDLVQTVGQQKGQLTLEVLRHGKRESFYLTPEERPTGEEHASPKMGGGGFGYGGRALSPEEEALKQAMDEASRSKMGGWFRSVGPGMVFGQAFSSTQLPDGVSMSIQKQGDQPAHLTLKRGDQTWEVVGNDQASIDKLPEDLRPLAQQWLGQLQLGPMMGDGMMPGMPDMPQMNMPRMPNMPRMGGRAGRGMPDVEQRMQERLDQMEQHLKELEDRMHGTSGSNSSDSSK